MTLTHEEARGFAKSLQEYGGSLREMDPGMLFYADAFVKAGEVINGLVNEIEAGKEREEGEKENSPTPYKEKGEMKERTNYQIRSRSLGLSPRYRSALQSSRFVGGYDLNVESGDMNLWDDARIVEEAATAACKFAAYAGNTLMMSKDESERLWRPLCKLIGWCIVNKDLIHFARKEAK